MRILIALIFGLTLWLNSKPQTRNSLRAPASESNSPVENLHDDEDTDYYESYKVRIDESKPLKRGHEELNKTKQLDSKPKKKKKHISNDPIGDESEWSNLSPERLNERQLEKCHEGSAKDCYFAGLNEMKDNKKKAIWLISKSCNLKNYSACIDTGKILKEVSGAQAAFAYFRTACEVMNDSDSCFESADYLEKTSGDFSQIEKYLNSACAEGNSLSCERLQAIKSKVIISSNN